MARLLAFLIGMRYMVHHFTKTTLWQQATTKVLQHICSRNLPNQITRPLMDSLLAFHKPMSVTRPRMYWVPSAKIPVFHVVSMILHVAGRPKDVMAVDLSSKSPMKVQDLVMKLVVVNSQQPSLFSNLTISPQFPALRSQAFIPSRT